ncbi:MAG: hypothetical protein S4CHLAM6_00220 [Chlamydiae bacterium]|nr:hypothetical protein [Chlamydiota bacterium]
MPQLDLKYSNNLKINTNEIFHCVEKAIKTLDASAGACKCRAYPTSDFLHENMLIEVSILKKPHRNSQFMTNLLEKINSYLKPLLPSKCFYAIKLDFLPNHYITSQL